MRFEAGARYMAVTGAPAGLMEAFPAMARAVGVYLRMDMESGVMREPYVDWTFHCVDGRWVARLASYQHGEAFYVEWDPRMRRWDMEPGGRHPEVHDSPTFLLDEPTGRRRRLARGSMGADER